MNAPQNRVPVPGWGWAAGLGIILLVSAIPGSGEEMWDLYRIISSFGMNLIVVAAVVAIINFFLPKKLAIPSKKLIIGGLAMYLVSGRIDLSGGFWILGASAIFMTLAGLVIAIITKTLKGFLMPFKWASGWLVKNSKGGTTDGQIFLGDRVSWEDNGRRYGRVGRLGRWVLVETDKEQVKVAKKILTKEKLIPGDKVSWGETTSGTELTGIVEAILSNGRVRVMGDDGIRRQLQPAELELT